jgi:hypothetical protein
MCIQERERERERERGGGSERVYHESVGGRGDLLLTLWLEMFLVTPFLSLSSPVRLLTHHLIILNEIVMS